MVPSFDLESVTLWMLYSEMKPTEPQEIKNLFLLFNKS